MLSKLYAVISMLGLFSISSGASAEEIIELTGCDLLTISPGLLAELESGSGTLEKKLDAELAVKMDITQVSLDEKQFRWMLNEDAMATEKLSEGIRKFNADLLKLMKFISERI